MNRYKRGWYGESHRHYLASKGVKTNRYMAGKNRYYAYTPTYVAGDLPVIAGDAVGTAGAEAVSLIPIAVPLLLAYGGAKALKKHKEKTGHWYLAEKDPDDQSVFGGKKITGVKTEVRNQDIITLRANFLKDLDDARARGSLREFSGGKSVRDAWIDEIFKPEAEMYANGAMSRGDFEVELRRKTAAFISQNSKGLGLTDRMKPAEAPGPFSMSAAMGAEYR